MSLIRRLHRRARRWVALILIATAAPPAVAQSAALPHGAPPDTLHLADAVATALRANPALESARRSAEAARERVPQAGALPDPRLSFGLVNRPLDGFGTDEPMTMNEVTLTQMIPWPGTLAFAGDRAAHLATASELATREAAVELAARVATGYYELAWLDRAIGIAEETRGLLRDFFQVAQTRYATGEGLQQDLLQAQVEVARVTEDLTVMRQDRVAAAARFNALLGRAATEPVGPLRLPAPGDPLPPPDSLQTLAASGRPALGAAEARIEAARSGYRAARRALYPDLMVSVGYGQRPRFGDMATVMVGVSVPLWAGRRALPLRREAAAMQASEEAAALDLANETFAQLTELSAGAERARNLSELYRTSILPQAQASVESALSAYRVGRADFQTLVQSQLAVNRYRIDAVRLTAEWHQTAARIAALVGRGVTP